MRTSSLPLVQICCHLLSERLRLRSMKLGVQYTGAWTEMTLRRVAVRAAVTLSHCLVSEELSKGIRSAC